MRLPAISDADARETLQVINRQNQRLTSLVSDLLLLSRLDTQAPPNKTPCRLQDILSDLEEELAALAIANNVHLILNQPQAPAIVVMGNEEHLYRLLFNLVSNALQHTPVGGKVSLQLQQVVRKTFPEGEKNQAVVMIEDTGVGIAPADQTKIFDRFYRVEKDRSRQSGGFRVGTGDRAGDRSSPRRRYSGTESTWQGQYVYDHLAHVGLDAITFQAVLKVVKLGQVMAGH